MQCHNGGQIVALQLAHHKGWQWRIPFPFYCSKLIVVSTSQTPFSYLTIVSTGMSSGPNWNTDLLMLSLAWVLNSHPFILTMWSACLTLPSVPATQHVNTPGDFQWLNKRAEGVWEKLSTVDWGAERNWDWAVISEDWGLRSRDCEVRIEDWVVWTV